MSLWSEFAFPWWLVMLSIFSYICWQLVCHLWDMSSQVLCSFFLLGMRFLAIGYSLFILDINLLSDIWLANIFPISIGCFFTLLIVPFAMPKLFCLMKSHLSIFAFVFCAFGVILKKNYCPDQCQEVFPLFSSSSFTVSGLNLSF